MAQVNLDRLSPTKRAEYIETGIRFGSDRTAAQGVESYNAANTHAEALRKHGFGSAKARRLGWAVDALRAAGGDREQARLAAGIGTDERHAASAAGKAARRQANNLLQLVIDEIEFAGAEKAAREVQRLLEQTASSGADLLKLDRQLETLSTAFEWEAVRDATEDCGGPEALEALRNARALLVPVLDRGRTNASHTPLATERLDLLDGIIVDLCRQARKASRIAARELAQPAMAKAFALDILYGRRSPPATGERTAEAS